MVCSSGLAACIHLLRPDRLETDSKRLYGIGSLLHSVNLILFTVLLVHLILRISPHYSHHLHSHHLSLLHPFTPDLKLISFTNPFLHGLLIPCLHGSWTCTDLGALAFVCFSFLFLFFFLATCARLSWSHSAFGSTLNSSIVSFGIVYIAGHLYSDIITVYISV